MSHPRTARPPKARKSFVLQTPNGQLYAECFCHIWDDSPAPMIFARYTTSPQAVREAGLAGLRQFAAQTQLRCRDETLHKILAWAEQAPPSAGYTPERQRQLSVLDDDRLTKTRQILELERDLAHYVVHTPYVLLLAIPGINIVTVADLAGELGPIELYLNANAITGRAGLMPTICCRHKPRFGSPWLGRPHKHESCQSLGFRGNAPGPVSLVR
jgi:hypothetical protein